MGLNRFSIPIVKKVMSRPDANKPLHIQDMVPAPLEVIGAIVLWFEENYPTLKLLVDDPLEYSFRVTPILGTDAATRVAVLLVWDRLIEFYESQFEIADPNLFTELSAAVDNYFWPKRSR